MRKILGSIFLAAFLLAAITPTAKAQDENCFAGFCIYGDAWEESSGWNNPDKKPLERSSGGTLGGVNSKSNLKDVDRNSLQWYILAIGNFLNKVIMPLLFAIALLVFLVNTARYFIIGAGDQENREKAKNLALYSIAAFVFLVSLWGIVNLLVGGLGWNDDSAMCPDYLGGWCTSN